MSNPFDGLIGFLFSVNGWDFAKLFVLLGLFLYLVFAVVVIRQVNLMIEALGGILNLPLKAVAWAHLILAIAVFLLAIFLL
ncbi:MAG TPA: DUF5657 family protein [Candidatus Bathyarchaeia archaeon]|nr:DUF5657 family protein [Candidatus Bathyarchaeia archaeon]